LTHLIAEFPGAKTYFNCTGVGARHLGDVYDVSVYPVRGQVLLVQNLKQPIETMYFRGAARSDAEVAYIFPRGAHGGVILGACRQENNWDGEADLDLADEIKRRCCVLCPELGQAEDLKVIHHRVGLRHKFSIPTR
jgi:glycine/D-amino acid oxidase-like deaminating enzyme